MTSGRTTSKECWNKIREARRLLTDHKWRPASPEKLKANFDKLESEFDVETTTTEDQEVILSAALNEITASDYDGSRPPEKSYEQGPVHDAEMYAFCWKSAHFGTAVMYIKFSICGANQGRRVYFYSIHRSDKSDRAS